jgi:hypothetical protein
MSFSTIGATTSAEKNRTKFAVNGMSNNLIPCIEFDIVRQPGVQHVVVDYLSRLNSSEAPKGVADDFLDTGVMALTLETGLRHDPDKLLMDIIHFLSHGVTSCQKWNGNGFEYAAQPST